MSAPDPLRAVADLRRCMQARDFAGVTVLAVSPALLAGLDELAAMAEAERRAADEARREAAALRLGEAERARVQAEIGPLLEELIGVLAGAMGVSPVPLCVKCRRPTRHRRNCPYCGTGTPGATGWPAAREAAA
jgi:hypothetical protein